MSWTWSAKCNRCDEMVPADRGRRCECGATRMHGPITGTGHHVECTTWFGWEDERPYADIIRRLGLAR